MGYEFNAEESDALRVLVSLMRFVAKFQLLLGVVMFGAAALMALQQAHGIAIVVAAQGAFNIAVALWVQRAALSFDKVVTTEGSDIAHLMDAMAELTKVFHLQKVMVLAVLATVGLGVAVTAFSSVGGLGGTGPEEGVHGAPPAVAP